VPRDGGSRRGHPALRGTGYGEGVASTRQPAASPVRLLSSSPFPWGRHILRGIESTASSPPRRPTAAAGQFEIGKAGGELVDSSPVQVFGGKRVVRWQYMKSNETQAPLGHLQPNGNLSLKGSDPNRLGRDKGIPPLRAAMCGVVSGPGANPSAAGPEASHPGRR